MLSFIIRRLLIIVPMALLVVTPYAVPMLFGEEYRSVTTILVVLSLCPPIRFLSTCATPSRRS